MRKRLGKWQRFSLFPSAHAFQCFDSKVAYIAGVAKVHSVGGRRRGGDHLSKQTRSDVVNWLQFHLQRRETFQNDLEESKHLDADGDQGLNWKCLLKPPN